MPFVLDNKATIHKPIYGAVDSIGASKTAVVTLPVGPTYRGITLELLITATAPTRAEICSMLTQFRLTLSGTEIFTLTGTQLVSIVEFYLTGAIGATGYLYIPFDRNWSRTEDGTKGAGLGTVGETSFSLEITQDASSTITTINVLADIDPTPQTLGRHVRYKRLSPSLPSSGTSQWPGLYKNPSDVLYALHVECSTASYLSDLALIGDGVRVVEKMTQLQLAAMYRRFNIAPRTVQTAAKVLSFDFCADGWDTPIPLTMIELLVEWTWGTAPLSLTVIAEIGTAQQTQAGLQYAAAQAQLAR